MGGMVAPKSWVDEWQDTEPQPSTHHTKREWRIALLGSTCLAWGNISGVKL